MGLPLTAAAPRRQLLELAKLRLAHDDSFVYQAALNALAAAAEVSPRTVMPRLAELLLPQGKPQLGRRPSAACEARLSCTSQATTT